MKQSVISYVPMAERYDVLVLGGGTAGDFRKAGRQPAFRAPDRTGVQPKQDGSMIALPERLAEGGGLLQRLRGKGQLRPVPTRGFGRQDGLQQLKKPLDLVQLGKAAGYAAVVAERRDGPPGVSHAQRRAAQTGPHRGTGA